MFFVGKTIDLATFSDSTQYTGSIYHDLESGLGRRSAKQLNFDYAIGAWNSSSQAYIALDKEYVWVKAA